MDVFFKSEGFNTLGFEESEKGWRRKVCQDIHVANVDACIVSCKSKAIMAVVKKVILTRFVGTDDGGVVVSALHHRYHSSTGCVPYLNRHLHQIIW